ncbi:hypothetical protein BN1708_011395 [Verticillium longisporum]|uniref:Cytoplasmic tRNA 2-thiolation protein 1 n=1 Tax=Verticillium longisporum TaxID=100787 RepID=A0A0G4KZN1_VERLO|nr:hypothetical protein BN1708_011395 [Verticillium longisporum]
MAPIICARCNTDRAVVKRPKNHQKICKACFISVFEDEVHHTILSSKLFSRGDRVAIGASGGKDSTVLASVLKTLNERHDYGLDLILLSIDEGIKGYRDDSLETVKRNAIQYDMPLTVVGYDELYGWTMDQVVGTVGKKGNCTYCGVFRRQALDRGSKMLGIRHLVTGHNADDIAETILMNLLRGDLPRLSRSTSIMTGDDSSDVKRSKPLKYSYEKEIVLYAHHKKLDYFSTECIYSPEAFRGQGSAEDDDVPSCGSKQGHSMGSGLAVIEAKSGEAAAERASEVDFTFTKNNKNKTQATRATRKEASSITDTTSELQVLGKCKRCGYMTSQAYCQACLLVDSLNKNRPRLEIGDK